MNCNDYTIDKSGWGDGPWQTEPDRLEFEHLGLPCLIQRAGSLGNLCGYVAVPPEHPMHGKHYDDVDVEVHGGLTYSGKCEGLICHVPQPGQPDDVWWLGFDCAHAYDISPCELPLLRSLLAQPVPTIREGTIYRDIEYVKAEVTLLAEQLAQMGGK